MMDKVRTRMDVEIAHMEDTRCINQEVQSSMLIRYSLRCCLSEIQILETEEQQKVFKVWLNAWLEIL